MSNLAVAKVKKHLLNLEVDTSDFVTASKSKVLTVRGLRDLLSLYPDDARVLLQNFNSGTILSAGITALTGLNATEKKKERVFVKNDEGPINAVALGFWNEWHYDIEYGPKLQAVMVAAIAENESLLKATFLGKKTA